MDDINEDNGTTRAPVNECWKKIWSPRIMKQGSLEKASNSKLRSVMKSLSSMLSIP